MKESRRVKVCGLDHIAQFLFDFVAYLFIYLFIYFSIISRYAAYYEVVIGSGGSVVIIVLHLGNQLCVLLC